MATNDTYNFYDQSRLVHIDHVDNINELINYTRNQASQDDVCEADFEVVDEDEKCGKSADCPKASPGLPFTPQLPKELKGEKAERILMKLYKKKILDENFQPKNLTGCQKGYLARRIADKLGITHVWVTFGGLWNMNPGTLRIRYNEALNNKNTVKFEKIIHPIFNER